ncbi:MAG: glycosyltransferase [Beijerinckiaceae bacterium]
MSTDKKSPLAMRHGRPLRVLHCPWNVAGQSTQLAAAERALGADSRCVVIAETAIGFPADECLMAKGDGLVAREIARWRLLWRAMSWADVVHFSFGQSCLVPHAFPGFSDVNFRDPVAVMRRAYARAIWLKDLPLLAAMGKRLAVTWQGDDARQHDRSLELFDTSIAAALGDSYYVPGSDEWKRRTIAAFDRNVPLHYALNPDLLHVLPKRAQFLPYASLDVAATQPVWNDADATLPLVFAHAPSHRGAKGTAHVLAAAEQLRREGHVFRLELVEGLQREAAMTRYARCDVVLDQLLAGWYGGLGLEAMALGKPVVSYLRESDFDGVPPAMRTEMPVINATQESIAAVMRDIIMMPRAEVIALGHRSRSFIERWHDPIAIAKRTLADYQGSVQGSQT